jgi:hypothetical protein
MATESESSRPETYEPTQRQSLRKPSQAEGDKRTAYLPHLFGPAALVLAIWLVSIVALLVWKVPAHFPKFAFVSTDPITLKELFNLQLSDYRAALAKLDTNLSAQALIVATAVLVIIRRSDSLNFFGNSMPLSWLHIFIPILLVFLFGSFGYISHRLISGRMLGLQMAASFPHHASEYQNLFRDASWIDAWFIAFSR